jgi:uncharacterized membrane protein YfcA
VSAAALAGVALVAAGAATVQLIAGFGFALAAVPLFSIVIDPHDAVIVSLGIATVTSGAQAWSGRASMDRGVVRSMLAGAVVGLPIGWLVYQWADNQVLGIVIGVAVLASVVVIARGLDLRESGPALDVGGGVLSGALTMSSSVNGPPLVFVLQARQFGPVPFRSTITTVFAVLDIVGIIIFAATGEIGRAQLIAIAAAFPGVAIGAAAGIALRRHLDVAHFRRLVLVLLVVAAISAIVSAIAAG